MVDMNLVENFSLVVIFVDIVKFVYCVYIYNFVFFVFREVVKECRRKKKEYVKCFENRVVVFEN